MLTRGPVTWAGGELAVTGELVSDGTFTVQAGGQLTGGGAVRTRGMLSLAREVTLAVRGPELASSGAIDLGSGILQLETGAHALAGQHITTIDLLSPDIFGRISSTGDIRLSGLLLIREIENSPVGQAYQVILANERQGRFAEVRASEGNYEATYEQDKATIQRIS